jgi:predicted pyridoxine 5'-phosphate oxidase superfamily flavin-nucleotide-binding protein
MGQVFARTMFSEAAKRLQAAHGSRAAYERMAKLGQIDDVLTEFEREFIAARDSLYLASVTPDGWPYLQHRGGPKGFLKVVDERTLAFADFAGNKQYITAGNLASTDRVALFLMDYPQQARLKIIGRARVLEPGADPELERIVKTPAYAAKLERIVVISVTAYDWNCSQHIIPRWTAEELRVLSAVSGEGLQDAR